MPPGHDIPMKVLAQYEYIRREGWVNMGNRTGVKDIAGQLEFTALERFIEDHDYADILMGYDRDEAERAMEDFGI